MKKISWTILHLLCLGILVGACSDSSAGLEIENAWARPADSGANSAVYFEIMNGGGGEILLSASSTIAERTEIHRTVVDEEGKASMEHQRSVGIPAGSNISFEPGGLHVMLINLSEPLNVGDTFELRLNFQNTDEVILNVPVQTP
jgi:copper(I)-binding protein